MVVKSRPRKGAGRHILEIDLLEVSAVTRPAHAATQALSWKTARDHPRVTKVTEEEILAVAAEGEKRAKQNRPIKVETFKC